MLGLKMGKCLKLDIGLVPLTRCLKILGIGAYWHSIHRYGHNFVLEYRPSSGETTMASKNISIDHDKYRTVTVPYMKHPNPSHKDRDDGV